MGQKTTKRTRKSSQRKIQGSVEGVDGARVQVSLPIEEVVSGIKGALNSVTQEAGLLVMRALIEDEVEQLAGPRYQRLEGKAGTRWGSTRGHVVLDGQKVPFDRPRVRGPEGDISIERYKRFQDERELEEDVFRKVLAGVSTRNYEGLVDDVCDGYGVKKSTVSRRLRAATEKELAALVEKRLDELDLAVLMVDGIHFRDVLLIVALGIDETGKKHVLGLWQGETENTEACQALLRDLVERGLKTDRNYLFVIDGSKGLRKGIQVVFGDRAQVQRCQVHKERNVLRHLPEKHQPSIRRKLRAAYKTAPYEEAKGELLKLCKELEILNPSAAASLQEGLEETLTLHRLGVPSNLRQILRSTNPIENCLATTRHLCRNVKRWRNANMAWRWAGTMLLAAEKKFRRIRGWRQMPSLVHALNPHIDGKEVAA